MTKKKSVAEYTEYIAQMSEQLASLAEETSRPFLGTLLRMAALEARNTVPASRDNRQAPKCDEAAKRVDLRPKTIGFFDWDTLNNRIYADAVFAKAFGVNAAKARAGASLEMYLDGVHSDDREYLTQAIKTAIAERALLDVEFRLVGASGKTRHVRVTGQGIYDRRGRAVRFPGTVIDITMQWLSRAA
jgi:PAS domain-containing protein